MGSTVSHAYLVAGTYIVTLTVSDGLSTAADSLTVSVAPAQPAVFSDNFNRPDSSSPGSSWQETQGDLVIKGNELRNAALKATHIAIVPAVSGLTQSATASFASVDNSPSPRLGVVLRFQGPGNYYLAFRQMGGTNALRISKVVNGFETILGSVAVGSPALNTFFRIGGDATGTQLSLTLDGVKKLTVFDSVLAAGSVGVLLGTGTSATAQYRADSFTGQVQ